MPRRQSTERDKTLRCVSLLFCTFAATSCTSLQTTPVRVTTNASPSCRFGPRACCCYITSYSVHKLSCPRKTCTVKVPQNAQRSDIVIYNFRNLVKLLLTLLVELPDDRLGEVVGLDDVASTRDPNHLSIRGLGAGPTLLQDFRFVTLLLDLD